MRCESCKRDHPKEGMTEVKVTAEFWNRKNEWLSYFCPRCLDYVQKAYEVELWQRKENKQS